MNWHNRLEEARKRVGIKKIDFAKLVGVSTASTTDWENGVIKTLSADKLLKICEVLRISPYWLMYGTQPELKPDEIELLECYREAEPEGKKFILRSARLETKSDE
jgi:transcriptional regulator with XRE-family HTH domain